MKDFDLEAAKRGAAVCTRSGLPARIVCFDVNSPLSQIVAVVYSFANKMETPQSYREDGGWLPANTECDQDLMMRDDDYLERLERGEYGNHFEDKLGMVAPTVKEKLTVETPTCKESLQVGVSRRDLLAGMAMQGWLSSLGEGEEPIIEKGAELCVIIADTLIAELDKPSEK